MIREHILRELAIKMLEADRELGDYFIWLLCNCLELVEQFSLGYLTVKKSKEVGVDILECRELPQIVAGVLP